MSEHIPDPREVLQGIEEVDGMGLHCEAGSSKGYTKV